MSKLVYSMNVSLDGFVETPERSLDWARVDEELHNWFKDQAESAAAFLYGRRLYELMAAYWPYSEADPAATSYMKEFGRVWRARPKIVFSSTLEKVDPNSRLLRGDPVAALPALMAEFPGMLTVGGPDLAAAFVKAGLVDEYRPVVHPVVLGSGKPFLPHLDSPISLRLTDSHRFGSGAVALGYARE
jgi:dihydrofolate reductase